ncbi:hypothetical protein IW261DRAFT_1567207 [Armillaria novae-zelandiae]|uniref:CxC2-like cysteine cluster KDZ transposase-associated domain-containing protein n=1 Tax=Armillaria novae-zelandiae TaxID=153914 RepID=A0AA39P3B1_9AGAR|nr:hypothetical protein IW261DRAFT_1567207 [Armillaria novae-zelandiae]
MSSHHPDNTALQLHCNKLRQKGRAEAGSYGQDIEITHEQEGKMITSRIRVAEHPMKTDTKEAPQNVVAADKEQQEPKDGVGDPSEEKRSGEKRAQNKKYLDEYMEEVELLTACDLAHNDDPAIGKQCSCGLEDVEVQCEDCAEYEASCRQCWVKQHTRYTWWHWALIWEKEGFFRRHDFSQVVEGNVIQLGHNGLVCPNPANAVIVGHVHCNGIHSSKFQFCECDSTVFPKELHYRDRVAYRRITQLMKARLFPAMVKCTEMAFSFSTMKVFQLQHLEGKLGLYDFIKALRRYTDNEFVYDVAVGLLCIRANHIDILLGRLGHLGQLHGIDTVLTHRPPGNLIVFCPVCPEPDFNLEPGWQTTSPEFKHINQQNLALDGNFHQKKTIKNSDPDNISLFEGKAYFPKDAAYKAYLKTTKPTQEKSVCNYLKVINNQNKRKFKSLEVTGVVSCTCTHVYVLSTVDLQVGEQFRNTDAALFEALKQRMYNRSTSDLDIMLSYDCNCSYHVNLANRFENATFDGVRDCLARMRYMIPDLHVNGHNDDCIYQYGSAYMECNGHNHMEGIEQLWIGLNMLAAQTCQMNNGFRQDTLINHHGDHNWKKTIGQIPRLVIELTEAKGLYYVKDAEFEALSMRCREQYPDTYKEWMETDRHMTYTVGKKKEVQSPYRFRKYQFPSLKSVVTKMAQRSVEAMPKETAILALSKKANPPMQSSVKGKERAGGEAVADTCETPSNDEHLEGVLMPETLESRSRPIAWIYEGILLENDQRKLTHRIHQEKKQPSKAEKEAIVTEREKLGQNISKWYKEATIGTIAEVFNQIYADTEPLPEKCHLLLPSALPTPIRSKLGIENLISYDAIAEIRRRSSTVAFMDEMRQRNDKGVQCLTRSLRELEDARATLELCIRHYNTHRQALLGLRGPDQLPFPYPDMTLSDTYRKRRTLKRALGDSRHLDGAIFGNMKKGQTLAQPEPSAVRVPIRVEFPGTQITRKKASQDARGSRDTKKTKTDAVEDESSKTKNELQPGWVWNALRRPGMTDEEVEAFEIEGERVGFFRAEAERDRWLEQWEIKIAEFLRCIMSFDKYAETWAQLATKPKNRDQPGYEAYAREKVHMYSSFAKRAWLEFINLGYEKALDCKEGERVQDFLMAQRALYEEEKKHHSDQGADRLTNLEE